MLNRIIAASLRHRVIVLVAALVVGAYGLFVATKMPIDVLPDLNRPVVTILTDAHGMTPEDVERLVTWPIEQVMNGATGVERVRSVSAAGLSTVYVEFEWGTDPYIDRQIVTEKLQLATPNLPDDLRPILAPISSIMGQVQIIGFQSAGSLDELELRRRVDRDVRPRLLALSGVAQVTTIGGQPSELQVVVDAHLLRAHGVTLIEVADAVRDANMNASGAAIAVGARGPTVSMSGLITTPDELEDAVVRADPVRPIRISDVAEVTFGPAAIPTGAAGINGAPGILVIITKQPGADTLDLTRRVEVELDQIRAELPDDVVVDSGVFQQAAFIERAIDNVLAAVRDGAILVIIILFLFLLNIRTTIITLTAIPLSVAVAALVFHAFGLSINTMTLGGLAIAVGTLVDDAIVDVENVFRRLHENARRETPDSTMWVLFDASSEVRRPVVYGTLLVTVVYLPLFFLSGVEGRLFAPIGLAYIVSVFASTAIALTVTPVMCYVLLGKHVGKSAEREYGGWLGRTLHAVAERSVRMSVAHTERIVAVSVVAVIVSGAFLFTLGSTFLPAFNEGTAQVNVVLPPDASLETSDRYGRQLEEIVSRVEGVSGVARRTGRSVGDEHAMPISVSEAIVNFDPESPRSREAIIGEIRSRLGEAFPGVATSTEQPLAHLLSHLLSGVTAQVAIKISGPDLAILRRAAKEAESAIAGIAGVTDLYVEPQVLIDHVAVTPRRADLARFGVRTSTLGETIELAMGGEEVSRWLAGRASYPITVRLAADQRRHPASIEVLTLRADDGSLTPISTVADTRLAKTPNSIQRENVQRRIVVQHNVADRPLSEVVADVTAALAPLRERLSSKPGYAVRISGQFEAQQEATRWILALSGLSILLIVMILSMHFRSARLALVVLVTRPVAFVGAAAYVVLSEQTMSVATLVGFIALLGIATRNAILLVDHAMHLAQQRGTGFTLEVLTQAARERVVPVLMTALTSGVGLVPLALAAGQPGRELLYPVATVMIGGLVTNTLLDFVVLPGLLARLGAGAVPPAQRDESSELRARLLAEG